MRTELKIFIAGSKELTSQRALIRTVASNLSTDYDRKGKNVNLAVYSFENFSMTFDKNGQQNNYEKFISDKADLVIFIFEDKVGGVTLDEFEVAYKSYSKRKHPLICVFSKKEPESCVSIDALRQRVTNLGQYYNEYTDEAELAKSVEFLLRDCIDTKLDGLNRKSMFKTIIMACAVALAIVLAVLLPKLSGTDEPVIVSDPPQNQTQQEQQISQPAQQTPQPQQVTAPVQAKPTLKSQADAGNPASCYQLAKNYQNGVNGVSKDLAAAFTYMKKAADAGYVKAFRPLAEMYHGGRGVEKNRESAAHWYKMAADNGDRSALQVLNNM